MQPDCGEKPWRHNGFLSRVFCLALQVVLLTVVRDGRSKSRSFLANSLSLHGELSSLLFLSSLITFDTPGRRNSSVRGHLLLELARPPRDTGRNAGRWRRSPPRPSSPGFPRSWSGLSDLG